MLCMALLAVAVDGEIRQRRARARFLDILVPPLEVVLTPAFLTTPDFSLRTLQHGFLRIKAEQYLQSRHTRET